jgi:Flp pilus assembly protein TadG
MALTHSLYATARRLRRACEGVAAVEFAFAFPILLMLVMGVIEISMVLFVSALMEGVLRDAARFGITGSVPAGETREQAIIDIVNDRLMGFIQVTSADVKMRVYKCLSDIGQPEPLTNDVNGNGQYDPGDSYTDVNGNGQWDADMAASGAGDSGDVVVYDLTAEWPLLTPFLTPIFGNGGSFPLKASIAVRNEPWIINNGQGGTC